MIHNPDPRTLSLLVAGMPKRVQYHDVLARVQREMGTDKHRSPSAGAVYEALKDAGYTTKGRGEYTRDYGSKPCA